MMRSHHSQNIQRDYVPVEALPYIMTRSSMENQHGEVHYQCEYCLYETKSMQRFHSHVQNHKSMAIAQQSCQRCGKVFSDWSVLQSHMKTHDEYRPFVCMYCEKRFKQKSSLTAHMRRLHLDGDNFKCPICDKMYHTNATLKRHVLAHQRSFDEHKK